MGRHSKIADTSPHRATDSGSPTDLPASVELLGVPLALTDYEQTINQVDSMIKRDEHGYICVAAVHTVMLCNEDPELNDAVLGASFTVPDGQPLVWALRALGNPLGDRVYGPELMERHCAHAARVGTPVYLYGGRNQGTLVELTKRLRMRFPGIQIVGGYSPPHRPLSENEQTKIADEINTSGAKVVWVGIGVPKQEKWMAQMRSQLTASVLIGVGAAFDFHAGLVPQAPSWMQHLGLEWLYRLMQEPRRLWRRYLRYNPLFVIGFLRQYATHRRAR